MMTRCFLAAVLGAFACGAGAADGGFYIGAGYGESYFEDHPQSPNGGSVTFDAHDRSYRALIGYRMRATMFVDLAAEGGYVDYGIAKQTEQAVTFKQRLRGAELSGLVILPAGPFDVYGKAGIVRWSSTVDIDGTSTSRSGTNGFYGLGAGFNVGKVGVRAEYDSYDVSVVDKLKTFTLDFLIRFR